MQLHRERSYMYYKFPMAVQTYYIHFISLILALASDKDNNTVHASS